MRVRSAHPHRRPRPRTPWPAISLDKPGARDDTAPASLNPPFVTETALADIPALALVTTRVTTLIAPAASRAMGEFQG